jgi:hypothetical protein
MGAMDQLIVKGPKILPVNFHTLALKENVTWGYDQGYVYTNKFIVTVLNTSVSFNDITGLYTTVG